MPKPATILFLASSPSDQARLRLGEEFAEIGESLRRSNHRDRFHLEQRSAIDPDRLRQALLDFQPKFVHFSGHGEGAKGLLLEDRDGRAHPASTESLVNLFSLFSKDIECVLLNACYSDRQAHAISQHIRYVIGMTDAISDAAAIEFAQGFYDGLGGGRSVEDAFKLGCNALQLEGIPEDLTPQLLVRPTVPAKRQRSLRKSQMKFKRLPYLIDRTQQIEAIERALSNRKKTTNRPILFLVSGDEKQCHDMFLGRLFETIREGLNLSSSESMLTKPIEWPVDIANPDDAIDRYRNRVLGCTAQRKGAPSPTTLNEYFAQTSGPIVLHTQIDIQASDWGKHEAKVLPKLVEFWQQWPDFIDNQPSIVCLSFIQYKSAKPSTWLHRFCRKPAPLARIDKAIAKLQANPQRLILEKLPQLTCIKRSEVEYWMKSLPLKKLGLSDLDLPDIKIAIRTIYEEAGVDELPLEDLVSNLQTVLNRYINPSEDAA